MALGAVILAAGAFLYLFGASIPLGRLPGDFSWQGKNWSVHFPLASCLIISIVLSLIAHIFKK